MKILKIFKYKNIKKYYLDQSFIKRVKLLNYYIKFRKNYRTYEKICKVFK